MSEGFTDDPPVEVVVGLTTIPSRLEKGLTMRSIQSIIASSNSSPEMKFTIVVNVPSKSRSGEAYSLEKLDELRALENVHVHDLEHDEGPITKLKGTLIFMRDRDYAPTTKIILIDDDCRYSIDFLTTLFHAHKNGNHRAIGSTGQSFVPNNIDGLPELHYKHGMTDVNQEYETHDVTFLETVSGAMYDFEVFQPLEVFFEWLSNVPDFTHDADDILIGKWIRDESTLGIKPKRFATDRELVVHHAEDTPELRTINLSGNNIKSAVALNFAPQTVEHYTETSKSKLIILQIEDRDLVYQNNLMKFNKKLAKERGYKYMRVTKSRHNVPPYWAKVHEIYDLLHDNIDNVEYVMWLDSDAHLNPTNDPIDLVTKDDHANFSMFITPDPPPWDGPFNAGVFIVKNNEDGRKIVSDWKEMYDGERWHVDEDGLWRSNGEWAGDTYEQGSFSKNILPNPDFSSCIKSLSYHILNEVDCDHPDEQTVAFHMAGHHQHDKTDVCKPS
jgi:hypothetical protein